MLDANNKGAMPTLLLKISFLFILTLPPLVFPYRLSENTTYTVYTQPRNVAALYQLPMSSRHGGQALRMWCFEHKNKRLKHEATIQPMDTTNNTQSNNTGKPN